MCHSFISNVKQRFFFTVSGRSSCFEFLFWFSSVILLSKMKSLFFSLWKFDKFSRHFWIHKSVFLQILHQSSMQSNITLLYFFSSKIYILWSKRTYQSANFWDISVLGSKFIKLWCQFWNDKLIPLQILHHSSLSWYIYPL